MSEDEEAEEDDEDDKEFDIASARAARAAIVTVKVWRANHKSNLEILLVHYGCFLRSQNLRAASPAGLRGEGSEFDFAGFSCTTKKSDHQRLKSSMKVDPKLLRW